MIVIALLQILDTALSFIFNIVHLGQVSALPTVAGVNMDTIFTTTIGTLKGVLTLLPPLQIVFTCLLLFYALKLSLLAFRFAQWIINLIRGSGT